MRRVPVHVIGLFLCVGIFAGFLQADDEGQPCQITLSTQSTGTNHFVIARVTSKGIPVRRVEVVFGIKRMFGLLSIADLNTGPGGFIKVPVSASDVAGDASGNITIVATISQDDTYADTKSSITAPWGKKVVLKPEPTPHELWSSRPPIALTLVILILVGGVWVVFGYILLQLLKIKKT